MNLIERDKLRIIENEEYRKTLAVNPNWKDLDWDNYYSYYRSPFHYEGPDVVDQESLSAQARQDGKNVAKWNLYKFPKISKYDLLYYCCAYRFPNLMEKIEEINCENRISPENDINLDYGKLPYGFRRLKNDSLADEINLYKNVDKLKNLNVWKIYNKAFNRGVDDIWVNQYQPKTYPADKALVMENFVGGYKIGKRISEKVLALFPDFPEHDEYLNASYPEKAFIEYCQDKFNRDESASLNHRIPTLGVDRDDEETIISSYKNYYNEGFMSAAIDSWEARPQYSDEIKSQLAPFDTSKDKADIVYVSP